MELAAEAVPVAVVVLPVPDTVGYDTAAVADFAAAAAAVAVDVVR